MVTSPWIFRQLTKLHHQRPELVDDALAQLLESNQELHWSLVVNAYLDEEINLGKAAELLGVHELELRQRFRGLGIPVRIGPRNLAEAQAEVEAISSWFPDDTSEVK
jgi:predicted HTH domain antitoxin